MRVLGLSQYWEHLPFILKSREVEKCWMWRKEINVCPCRTLSFHWICIQLIIPFLHLGDASVQFSRRTLSV